MDLSVEFRPALGVKRESSVSPPGWDHSSEGDRPLDFSRQSPSATNGKVVNDADSAKKCPVSESEQDSPRAMPEQRKLLLTNSQQLRFHDVHRTTSPPQRLSPNFQSMMGLAPNVLQSNESHLNLYESLVLKSLQSGSSPQHLFDPSYIHFRNQQFLLQKKMQNTQRRKAVPTSTPTPTPSTGMAKSSDSTEPSSELSDQSNDSSHVHHSQADSTNPTTVLPTVLSPPTAVLPTSSSGSNSSSSSSSSSASRRRGNPFPDELKDNAYWERRRKNNEAAKRSRDARRAKEDEIAIRAAYLEQENIKLKVELSTLNQQLAHLRAFVEARQI